MEHSSVLWYASQAGHWVEALPIGNGRLGAMVFGGAASERFQLNEESLWSGFPRDCDNPDAINHLPEVRKAVFDGDYLLADALCKKMQGAVYPELPTDGRPAHRVRASRGSPAIGARWIWILPSPKPCTRSAMCASSARPSPPRPTTRLSSVWPAIGPAC